MKKRGRKKKNDTEQCTEIISSTNTPNSTNQTKISFGETKKKTSTIPAKNDTKRNLSFGGLNITIHSAKKTDVSEVSKLLRFGSTTADKDNKTSNGKIEYGKVIEKPKTIRTMPSRMCEIVEHNSDDEEIIEQTPQNNDKKIQKNIPRQITTNRLQHKSNMLNSIFEQNTGIVLPSKTNLWCWWCCHSFNTSPCFLPTIRDEYRNRYVVIGNFCSWNCVKAYNIDQGDSQISKRNDILRALLKKIGIRSEEVKAAPPRNSLKELGGPLDINTFRKSGGLYSQNKQLSCLTIALEPSLIIKKKEKLSSINR